MDFNLILDVSDKNNANINQCNLGRFRRFVNKIELKDISMGLATHKVMSVNSQR